MSAIDTTFHWVRNPTAINGLQTTYCSKRGSDVSGDGTAQNPYASIAKSTSVATANTNIMLDDGIWSQQRTLNNRAFKWWGNGRTEIDDSITNFTMYSDTFNYFNVLIIASTSLLQYYCHYCNYVRVKSMGQYPSVFNGYYCNIYNTIVAKDIYGIPSYFHNCNITNCYVDNAVGLSIRKTFYNNVLIGPSIPSFSGVGCDYNNYTTLAIPTTDGANAHSINNASTGQTVSDYFNKYDANNWLQCDFTAKAGSANIGAGEKGRMIGFNQGYTMYADNSADNVFKVSNGATRQNIEWDSTLNGYVLVQKERVCQGATATTITLDSEASAVDDYYNNLFIGIVAGDGYGELFLINDYDGATKTVTIDGTWVTIPTANTSIYTISGTILSAVKDLGKAIKVKRNWTFADNFTALTDGQWAEFMTHVGTNGKQFPTSCYSYEYSIDGVNFFQGQTADDLVSATNGDNKVTDNIYGDCSANYDKATAKNLVMRYIRVRVNIGFNIGQLGE